ncbi:hypothetical protein HRR83_007625 [Exophiala dermatitidis]|nr:hypothetical protein HRR74_007136 [Exophiala dermatitidis]KAJ4521763.1 hypothetical protein HRR73_002961 [Exophiala dermatitidis]KAJ4539457.1 hypothetical protein HRR77_006341 [Exophiala dermatitidis]KAJ4565904.1 hypothetical protein HRR81_007571 [Exophiala dermatitidis]KAJ4589490.1 hypothetical protein HRR84_007896 [Exophiala dermatitidis]
MSHFRRRILGRGNNEEETQPQLQAQPDADEPWGFQIVHEGTDPLVDIIAIHGVNGHREKTWTHENGTFWLRDLLAKEPSFSRTRIMTYGYNSRTHARNGVASLQTLPGYSQDFLQHLADQREGEGIIRRPIFFVVHSLGGIVLKSALVDANLSDKSEVKKGIKLSTFGILFLGTPHEGSNAVPLGLHALRIAGFYYSINDSAVKELGAHSQWLEHQTNQFNTIRHSFRIRNCYETMETRLGRGPSLIVPKWSAAPPAWDTEAVGINRNHITLTKFTSTGDQAYQRIRDVLMLMTRDAEATVKRNWDEWSASQAAQNQRPAETIQDLDALVTSTKFDLRSNLPLKNESFIGRVQERTALRHKLAAPSSNRLMVLFGPGGVGKTQLALKYCWDYKSDYSTVLWFNAANLNAIQASFMVLANRIIAFYKRHSVPLALIVQYLELEGLVQHDGTVVAEGEGAFDRIADAVNLWLDIEGNHQWLAVFDNYEPEDFPAACRIERYLPKARLGTIVITTRRRNPIKNGRMMEISCFSGDESLQLLLCRCQKDGDDLSEEEKRAIQITEELGQFPLAIDQAGAYISHEDILFASYLELYRKNNKYLLQKKDLTLDPQYNECVFTTWETSYRLLEKRNQEAAELLALCSFFFNVDIPERIFQGGLIKTEQQVKDLFSEIHSFSLIRRHHDDSYSIHTLIHTWARQRLDLHTQRMSVQRCVEILTRGLLVDSNFGWTTTDDVAFRGRIRLHALTVLDYTMQWDESDLDPEGLQHIGYLSDVYYKYDDAERFYKLALDASGWDRDDQVQSTPDPKKVYMLVQQLARIYLWQARPALAIALYRQYLKTKADHSDLKTAMITIDLAMAARFTYQWEEAERQYRRSIVLLEKLFGPRSAEVLGARSCLGCPLACMDRLDEAMDECQYALDQLIEVAGIENPHTLGAFTNLALCYVHRGDDDRALPLFEEAAELGRRVFGPEHPWTVSASYESAKVCCRMARTEEAKTILTSVVAAWEKTLGPFHIDTVEAMTDLADTYRRTGRSAEAGGLYEKTLKAANNDHYRTVSTDWRRRDVIDYIQEMLEAGCDENKESRQELLLKPIRTNTK